MTRLKMFLGTTLLICFLAGGSLSFAMELKWVNSATSAFSKAMREKKKILLFVGRESCGNCRYMKTQVFESMKPAVKTLLQKHFILWFSDVDKSKEWHRVAHGLAEIPLPLICIIDPATGKAYEDRSTGIQHSPEFYSRLLKSNGKK